MHFSVEMETGTGKTYGYLRSIYEPNKLYGFKKFVVVVPSVAIREEVLINLEITHEQFWECNLNSVLRSQSVGTSASRLDSLRPPNLMESCCALRPQFLIGNFHFSSIFWDAR